jgi:hypothetical protein
MEPFTLTLDNGKIVAGISNIPLRSASPLQFRPLLVGLHGGTYECHYFDADTKHTAAISSAAYGVPFISIDRPCYGKTGSFLPVLEGSSFPRETGIWLHTLILPALWTEFGIPNDCNCIVLLCHSLGVMAGVPAAALHAQTEKPSYPLGGIICCGLGDKWLPHMEQNRPTQPNYPPDRVTSPLDVKDAMMFLPGTVHPDILKLSERLHFPAPFAEVTCLPEQWLPSWKDEWAIHVKAPVMFTLVEQEPFFNVSEERLKSCANAFSTSVRVESSLIPGAPHCIELSYWSQAWYARCFGFAMECATNMKI